MPTGSAEHSFVSNRAKQIQKISRRTGQPIQPGHNEYVAFRESCLYAS